MAESPGLVYEKDGEQSPEDFEGEDNYYTYGETIY